MSTTSMAVIGVNLASFALILESSALTVALPVLAREWRASASAQRWILDASLLTTALLLFFAGRLSDAKGTRRIMRLGLVGVAACAVAAAFAWSPRWLIAIRLIQGACAALVIPGTLGLLRLLIPDDEDRLRAMAWWSAITIGASAAGPIAGGLIVDAVGWRAIFALPALLSMIAWWCLRVRGSSRRDSDGECNRALPALSMLLKDRAFLASNVASGSLYFAVYGLSFALATKLPESLSSSSLQTGLYMAPPAMMMLALASPVAYISSPAGRWRSAVVGAAVCAAGLYLLATTIERATPINLVAITALIGVGFALTLGPLDALMMERPSRENSNLASAFGHVSARLAGFAAIATGGMPEASAVMAVVAAATASLMLVAGPVRDAATVTRSSCT
jgi:MFS family permease